MQNMIQELYEMNIKYKMQVVGKAQILLKGQSFCLQN